MRDYFLLSSTLFSESTGKVEEAMISRIYIYKIADLTDDGIDEIVLTISTSADSNQNSSAQNFDPSYKVVVFEVTSCSQDSCVYKNNLIEGDSLHSMSAAPFLVNLDGEGSPQFLTFEGTNRYIAKKSGRSSNLKYTKENFTSYLNNR